MEAIDAILTRRSIRKYLDKSVSDDLIKQLLISAVSAPSAGNQQPWHFVIINDKNILSEITKSHPHAKFLKGAPCAILVCGDLSLETFKGYWMIDCAAATENILISIRALGLGSCWIGIYPREERMKTLKTIIRLPENIIPFSLISIGYTDEKQKKVNRSKSMRVHYNSW
jgi:nitroreductase